MTFEEFVLAAGEVLGPQRRPNPEQLDCLQHPPTTPLMIVAGPGSGKTAVLVLRALRHVVVDRLSPEQIVITTFTRKAAREVRTRIIEWGTPLIEFAAARATTPEDAEFLSNVDINRFVTGTLDSICEDILANDRGPNERPPTILEAFAADQTLARRGEVFGTKQRIGAALSAYLHQYSNSPFPPTSVGDLTRAIRVIVDRLIHDEVDRAAYASPGPHAQARSAIIDVFDRYTGYLRANNQMDFAMLEQVFLERLRNGGLGAFCNTVRAVLVDEYQDTNPLQELIYLEIARRSGAALSVVGDDDQSLYRFRGATIELFRDFRDRVSTALGTAMRPALKYLVENYRSTPQIVDFFNAFIQNDADFGPARIQPPKPRIHPNNPGVNVDVLGMFRDNPQALAGDLATFLEQVFRGAGRPADARLGEAITRHSQGGDLGDAVFISHTVNEVKPSDGAPRLPLLLRAELIARGLHCFNPRGQKIKDIPQVQIALGLILECLDRSTTAAPEGPLAGPMLISAGAKATFREWRQAAGVILQGNPGPVGPNTESLRDVVERWSRFTSRGGGPASDWPLLDVLYNLLPWLPLFQDDPEHQVYLEAISRAIAQAATFSSYRAFLLRDEPHRHLSVEAAIRDVLAPIADDLVDVDEEILASVPRDRLNFMTIHQAKGLEFPLVIVDISSDFKSNHHTQRFLRYPSGPSPVTLLEDDLAPATPIGPLRTGREAIQRTFEDLIRLYYVAYSRPQHLLMLVGCIPVLRYPKPVPHVATYWRRDGTWPWQVGTRPATTNLANSHPLILL